MSDSLERKIVINPKINIDWLNDELINLMYK
jgi:hypothetical protein